MVLLEPDKLPVSDKTLQTLKNIIDTRELPPGFDLEVITRFQPNDTMEVTKWSVRLRIPAEPKGMTTCIMLRDNAISSRLFGEEERKIIDKWNKHWKEQHAMGFNEMDESDKEREQVAEIDRARQKSRNTSANPLKQFRSLDKNPEQPKQRYTSDMTPVPDGYRLAPDDRIFIHYDVSREIGSGKFPIGIKATGIIPLIGSDRIDYGEINVLGMSLDEAEDAIARRIKEVRSKPTVSLTLLDDFDQQRKDINKDSYRIIPGDRMQVQVPIMPDGYLATQSGISAVQPDGNVMLNLNNHLTFNLKLGGLTVTKAEESMRDYLITKVKTPKVTVELYTLRKIEQNPPESYRITPGESEKAVRENDAVKSDNEASDAMIVQINEHPDGPWAGMPNNVFVALLAIGDDDHWWQPNGAPLAAAPYSFKLTRDLPAEPGFTRRKFVIQLRGLPQWQAHVGVTCQVKPGSKTSEVIAESQGPNRLTGVECLCQHGTTQYRCDLALPRDSGRTLHAPIIARKAEPSGTRRSRSTGSINTTCSRAMVSWKSKRPCSRCTRHAWF